MLYTIEHEARITQHKNITTYSIEIVDIQPGHKEGYNDKWLRNKQLEEK
jgi:hypothetical protein